MRAIGDTANALQRAATRARQDPPAPAKPATPRRAALRPATLIPAGDPASRHTFRHSFPFYADARPDVGYYAETGYPIAGLRQGPSVGSPFVDPAPSLWIVRSKKNPRELPWTSRA